MSRYTVLAISLLVTTAFCGIIYPYGLGVTHDSAFYMLATESVKSGEGYTVDGRIVTHWPPMYSLLLSLTSIVTGLETTQAGFALNALLVGLLYLLTESAMRRTGVGRPWAQIMPACLVFSSPMMVSTMFWSELPFIVTLMGGYLCLLKWMEKREAKLLIVCGSLSAVMLMTRYAGAGFIAGFALLIWLFPGKEPFRATRSILLYLLPISVAVCLWRLYTLSHSVPSGMRDLQIHLIDKSKFHDGLQVAMKCFASNRPATVFFILFGSTLAYRIFLRNATLEKRRGNADKVLLTLLLPVAAYVFFILLSISFIDAATPIDLRIMSPAFPFVFMALCLLSDSTTGDSYKWQTPAMMGSLALSMLLSSAGIWERHLRAGTGYTGVAYSKSKELVESVCSQSDPTTLYTNGDDMAMLYNRNPNVKVRPFPRCFDFTSLVTNVEYDREVRAMVREVSEGKAKILFLEKMGSRIHLYSKNELLEDFGDKDIRRFKDGIFVDWSVEKPPARQPRMPTSGSSTP